MECDDDNDDDYEYDEEDELGEMDEDEREMRRLRTPSQRPRVVKLVPCEVCSKVVATRDDLVKHIDNMHLNQPCKICGQDCAGILGNRKHMQRVHTTQCQECETTVVEREPWKEGTTRYQTRIVECQQCEKPVAFLSNEDEEFTDESDDGSVLNESDMSRLGKSPKIRGISETIELSCEICKKIIRGKWAMQKHVERMHMNIRKYPCKICPEKMYDVVVYKKHMKKIHTIKCEGCGVDNEETTPWPEGTVQTDERELECGCGAKLVLKNPAKRVRRDPVYYYDEEGALKKKNMPPVKNRRLEKIPLNCEYCGKTILGKWSMRKHIENMHTGDKKLPCSICHGKFSDKHSLKTHFIHVHTRMCKHCRTYVEEVVPWPEGSDKSMERIEKCKCGQNILFVSQVGRRSVMEDSMILSGPAGIVSQALTIEDEDSSDVGGPGFSVHVVRQPKGDTSFQCTQCTKTFLTKKSVMSHVENVHAKARPFVCGVCQDSFVIKHGLEMHMSAIHTKKCGECGKYLQESQPWTDGMHKCSRREVQCACGASVVFVTARGLKRKEPEEEEDGPPKLEDGFACRSCGKLFKSRSRCMRHELSHFTGQETFCSQCNVELNDPAELKKHMETVHSYKFYLCDLCDKGFESEAFLSLHMAKKHSGELKSNNAGVHQEGETTTITEEMLIQPYQQFEELKAEQLVDAASFIPDMTTDPEVEKVMSGLGPGQTMISQVEGGVIYVATRDTDLTTDGAREFVQQAIKDGHVSVPSGTISIILNKL